MKNFWTIALLGFALSLGLGSDASAQSTSFRVVGPGCGTAMISPTIDRIYAWDVNFNNPNAGGSSSNSSYVFIVYGVYSFAQPYVLPIQLQPTPCLAYLIPAASVVFPSSNGAFPVNTSFTWPPNLPPLLVQAIFWTFDSPLRPGYMSASATWEIDT